MKILVIKMSAIGDVILASSLIPALKRQFPESKLSWFAEPRVADLLKNNPELDELILWDRKGWKHLFKSFHWIQLTKEVISFCSHLRKSSFDLVIDAQGLLKSGLFARLTGAPRRVGFRSKEKSHWFMTESFERDYNYELISAESRQIAAQLGMVTEPFPMSIVPSKEDQESAQQILNTLDLTRPYAILCPYTTRPQKHWFDDYWIELARSLSDEHGVDLVILGGPGDQLAATSLADQSAGSHSLAGKTSLSEAAHIVQNAQFLIGVDTGLTHLGTAMRTPTIGLWGSTRPYLRGDDEKTLILYDDLDCSPCHRRPTCKGEFTCLRQITPARVINAVSKLTRSS